MKKLLFFLFCPFILSGQIPNLPNIEFGMSVLEVEGALSYELEMDFTASYTTKRFNDIFISLKQSGRYNDLVYPQYDLTFFDGKLFIVTEYCSWKLHRNILEIEGIKNADTFIQDTNGKEFYRWKYENYSKVIEYDPENKTLVIVYTKNILR